MIRHYVLYGRFAKLHLRKITGGFPSRTLLSRDGIGIGLTLAKELVGLAQGTIAVNIIEGSMIQFTVALPVDKGEL